MRADQVLKNLGKKQEKKQEEEKEYAKAREWSKCCHSGCPMWATIKSDRPTCTFHYRKQGRESDAITEALKEYYPHYRKYGQMQKWDVKTWLEKAPQIMGWPVLPATQDEINMPTVYLSRFYKWLTKSINDRATDIYQGYE